MANDDQVPALDDPELEIPTDPQRAFEEMCGLMGPQPARLCDPAAAASLAEHLKAIAALLTEQGPAAAWEVGGHYHAIVSEKLIQRSGERMVQLPGGVSTLKLYARVRRAFSQEEVSRYGAVCLDRLLRYRKAAGAVAGGDIGAELISVPREDGSVEPKPFANCSERDLSRAARAARRKGGVFLDLAQRIDAAVAAASDGEVHMSVTYKRGKPAFKLTPIPVGNFRKVAGAFFKAIEADAPDSGAAGPDAGSATARTLKPTPSSE